jgi:hypothetical protein
VFSARWFSLRHPGRGNRDPGLTPFPIQSAHGWAR